MPTYDYECTKCGYTFDAFQSMSEDPFVKCPNCHKNGLKRLIGGGMGVIFKGSGFYVTDNRGSRAGGGKTRGDSASESSKPSESSGSDSSGSKEKKSGPADKAKAAT